MFFPDVYFIFFDRIYEACSSDEDLESFYSIEGINIKKGDDGFFFDLKKLKNTLRVGKKNFRDSLHFIIHINIYLSDRDVCFMSTFIEWAENNTTLSDSKVHWWISGLLRAHAKP